MPSQRHDHSPSADQFGRAQALSNHASALDADPEQMPRIAPGQGSQAELAGTLLQLLRNASWRRWITASLMARLPLSMVPLAFVVVGQARDGSVTLGATLTGFGSLCACVAAPLRGRLLDRQELRRAIQIDSLIAAAVFALVLVVLQFHLPVWTLFVLSVGQGWAMAGLMSGLRALLVVAVPEHQLRRSHFVESLITELCYGVGPILVGVLTLIGGARLTMLVMLLIQSGAALSLRRIGRMHPSPLTRSKLHRRRDIQRLSLLVFCVSLGYGILEANVPQRMEKFGLSAGAGGWFLGILAAGSCIGGLVVSVRPTPRSSPRLAAALLCLVFSVLILPSVLADDAVWYAVTLIVATMAFVPLTGLTAAEFEARLGDSQRGEGFAYFITAMMLGGAVGYLGNGLLIGPITARSVPLISAALFFVVGLLLIWSYLAAQRRPDRHALAVAIDPPGCLPDPAANPQLTGK